MHGVNKCWSLTLWAFLAKKNRYNGCHQQNASRWGSQLKTNQIEIQRAMPIALRYIEFRIPQDVAAQLVNASAVALRTPFDSLRRTWQILSSDP